MNGHLIDQLMEAVSRAMARSPEVRELAGEFKRQGISVTPTFTFRATEQPEITDGWLEALYRLEDRR
jgi:hypothetical protein